MMDGNTVDTPEGNTEKEETEEDISSKLAFRADPDKLDEDGKPRSKVPRIKMSRNESEKLRRDRLNAYIGELAKLVPLILTSNRKMDKSSVLRLTVNYLRMYHDLAKNPAFRRQWRPDFLNSENLASMLLESTGGFLMVISRRGTLTFCTDAITDKLGHHLVDVLGNPLYSIIHPDDHATMQKQFYYMNEQDMPSDSLDRESVMPKSSSRSFYVRMLDNSSKQNNKYQNVHIVGHLKSVPPVTCAAAQSGLGHLSEADWCLVCVGRIDYVETPKELFPAVDAPSDQWMTRHEIDGKLTFSDPRCAFISGFMPDETNGMSPYALVHKDDICVVVNAHKDLFSGETPISCFRMYTKSQDIVYVKTNTHVVVDMWTSKPRYIISINSVLPKEQGKKVLDDVKSKLENMTKATELLSIESSEPDEVDEASASKCAVDSPEQQPCSPMVPEDVIETNDRLDVYIEKTKYYSVDLKLSETCAARSARNSVDNVVYDSYPPVNIASQTASSPAAETRSPKPVFLGASPQPNDVCSVGGRSAQYRSNSMSSQCSNPSSAGKSDSPSSSVGFVASHSVVAHPAVTNPSHHTLLQQLNKQMAAAPPQLQSRRPHEHHLNAVYAPTATDSGNGKCISMPPCQQNNNNLVNLLKRPPEQLNGFYNGKIMSEIPGIEQWQQEKLRRSGDSGYDGAVAYSAYPGVSNGQQYSTDLHNYSVTQPQPPLHYSGMTRNIGDGYPNNTVNNCPNGISQMLGNVPRNRSPPSYPCSSQEQCLINNVQGYNELSDPSSMLSATHSASPCQQTRSPGKSSTVSPQNLPQLQQELDIQEIEAKSEVLEHALEALKVQKQLALQVKQGAKSEDLPTHTTTSVVNSSFGNATQLYDYSQQTTNTTGVKYRSLPKPLSTAAGVLSTHASHSFQSQATHSMHVNDTSLAPELVHDQGLNFTSFTDLTQKPYLSGSVTGEDWNATSETDMAHLINALSSSGTQGTAASLDQQLGDQHVHLVDQFSRAPGQYSSDSVSFDSTPSSLHAASQQLPSAEPSSLENKSLIDKLKHANLTPGQYLKLLSQFHSVDSVSPPGSGISQPVTYQNAAPVTVTSPSQYAVQPSSSGVQTASNMIDPALPMCDASSLDVARRQFLLTSTDLQQQQHPQQHTSTPPHNHLSAQQHTSTPPHIHLAAQQHTSTPPHNHLAANLTQRLSAAKQNPSQRHSNNDDLFNIVQQLIENGDRTIIDALLKANGSSRNPPQLD